MSREEITGFLGDDWIAVQTLIADALRSDIGLLNIVNSQILAHGGSWDAPDGCTYSVHEEEDE